MVEFKDLRNTIPMSSKTRMMNPYLANPDDIPSGDRYAEVPFYGRYFPKAQDFRVDPEHINSNSEDSLRYWSSVLAQCTEAIQIYPADDYGRDVFALGTVIIKSGHLHEHAEIDYTYADDNEVQAIAIAKDSLKGVAVPNVFFAGKIGSRQVLVQERLAGVGLNVAWPYLSASQRTSFKYQARQILLQMHAVKPTDNRKTQDYVVQDPNILTNGRIRPVEADILLSPVDEPDLGFMHNDFSRSNCIVDKDKIVGLVDWEMAGFFGWDKAAEVHRKIRTPQREHFVKANLSEDELREIMCWNDLYDFEVTKA